MMGKTHMAVGAVFGMGTVLATHTTDPAAMATLIGCSTAGALLPDIDHPNSKLAHSNIVFGTVSNVVCMFTKHRHFCHSILFCGLAGVGAFALCEWLFPLIFGLIPHTTIPIFDSLFGIVKGFNLPLAVAGGIFIGSISHLAADILNPEGAPLLWPWKYRFSIMPISTNSIGEKIFDCAVAAVTLGLLFIMYKQGYLNAIPFIS